PMSPTCCSRAPSAASRVRLMRQLLTESLLLAAVGGLAGLLLSKLSLGVLARLVPAGMAASGVFGLAPAMRASKLDLNQGLKQTAGKSGRSDRRLRSALVIAEMALALALLVCAQLMIQTFLRLRAVDPGFRAE